MLSLQTCTGDNPSPLPTSVSERRASADYNVIELSRQYRKKELSQMRASSDKFQLITDTYRLQQMVGDYPYLSGARRRNVCFAAGVH